MLPWLPVAAPQTDLLRLNAAKVERQREHERLLALQKRLEEDLRRSRVESAERHKKLTDAEKLVCPAAPCCAPPLCGARDGAGGWSASRTLPFALAAG